MEKFVRREAAKLKIGDIVARFDHATGERRTQGVAHVSSMLGCYPKIRIGITIVWPRKETVRVFAVKPTEEFMVKARTTCGAHVCDSCMIERDANRMVICKAHWNAWEMVA